MKMSATKMMGSKTRMNPEKMRVPASDGEAFATGVGAVVVGVAEGADGLALGTMEMGGAGRF